MKFLSRSTLCLVLCLVASQGFAAELGTYENYRENVENYCGLKKSGIPNASELWEKWGDQSLISRMDIEYANIADVSSGDARYKSHLSKIKSDPSKITAITLTTPDPNYLQKASFVYSETMNAIYACALMNAKKRIINGLLPQIDAQSNITRDLKKQVSSLTSEIANRGCRDISGDTTDNKESGVQKILLDNTMYQYCNYRFYLHYLSYNAQNSAEKFFKDTKNTSGTAMLSTTDQAAGFIAEQGGLISKEIREAREIYPQALVAYSEFERTYGAHILLTFILQDYIEIRDTLKQVLNPIGQVIYKASNAQSPGSWVK